MKEVASEWLVAALDDLKTCPRYPGDRGLLPDGKPTLDDAKSFSSFAKRIYEETCSLVD